MIKWDKGTWGEWEMKGGAPNSKVEFPSLFGKSGRKSNSFHFESRIPFFSNSVVLTLSPTTTRVKEWCVKRGRTTVVNKQSYATVINCGNPQPISFFAKIASTKGLKERDHCEKILSLSERKQKTKQMPKWTNIYRKDQQSQEVVRCKQTSRFLLFDHRWVQKPRTLSAIFAYYERK